MELINYRALTERLHANLMADERVLGLVALGSMAEISRLPDGWSDHDFFVVTVPDVQEEFRQNLTWLPDHDQIVLQVRETAHGLKILYKSGHLMEFAVFDEAELASTTINDYRVLLDRSKIALILAERAAQSVASTEDLYDPARDLAMVLALVYVGAGRLARGEGVSAHVFIKYYALQHVLSLLTHLLDSVQKVQLDCLDPFRRFEVVFPEVGAALNRVLAQPPLVAARALLDLVDDHARLEMPAYPHEAARIVRAYLREVEHVTA